jgi:integrase
MHVGKMPNGRWRVIVQHDGQRRSATAPTKAGAQRLGAQILLEMGVMPRTDAAPTVGALLAEHLATREMRPTSRHDFRLIVDRLPAWVTGTPVGKVDTLTVERWYARLTVDGWTVHRVRKLHTLLRSAWNQALRWGWAAVNPVSAARAPSAPTTHLSPPTPAQVVDALRAADELSSAFGVFIRLAASSGARRGELCGLRWDDIDTDAALVAIRRSVAYVDGELVVSDTKTGRGGQRVVSVSLPTAHALRAHRRTLAELALREGLPDGGWVFTHDLQTPWRPDYTSRMWRTVRERVGMSDVRLHDLRHYVATELLGAGVDVRTVAGRLGHAQASTTLDVYAAFLPANDRAAADLLEQRLTGG